MGPRRAAARFRRAARAAPLTRTRTRTRTLTLTLTLTLNLTLTLTLTLTRPRGRHAPGSRADAPLRHAPRTQSWWRARLCLAGARRVQPRGGRRDA